jgi:tetratricopeptide (TPR) repeat protein
MRSFKGHLTSLAITVVSLALLIPARGAACALGGRPGIGSSLLPASNEEKSAPLSQEQTLNMLQAGVPSRQIEAFARQDGIDFKVTPALERDLRKAGATEGLIQLLKKLGNGPTPAPAGSAEVSALLRTAEDALAQKDFAEAAKALKAVVAKQPAMPEAWFNLGYAYSGLHETDEAAKAYQKTLELAPDLFAARLNLGILLLEQKQPQAALEHLQKATTLKPEHVRAHLYYARALAQTGQPDAARKEFQEVTRLDPHLAIAQYEIGQLELQQKHPAEALAAFQKALAADPKLVQAELGAALAAEALNDTAQAVTHFEKYLASRPDDVETQFHLARLYLQQNQNEKARDTLEGIYHVKPDLPGLTAALGDVNARLKKLPEAEKYYRQAVSGQPVVVDFHRALGEILLDEQKYPEAEGEFRTALQLDAHNRDAAIGLASSLYFQKRYTDAIPLLEQLAKAPDAAPYVFFVLATCYDQLRARKEALANYERFLQLSHGEAPDQEWQATQRAKLLRRELSK